MRVTPEHAKARHPTDKVNSIGNSALYCSKKFEGNFQLSCKRKGDKYKKETWPFRQMSWCSKR